tara:strand:- start:187 stop:534 length:348 start_codon:yes stop_codon:yes gene_type:complete
MFCVEMNLSAVRVWCDVGCNSKRDKVRERESPCRARRKEEELFQKDKSASMFDVRPLFFLSKKSHKTKTLSLSFSLSLSLSLLFSSLTLAPSHALDRREKEEEEEEEEDIQNSRG